RPAAAATSTTAAGAIELHGIWTILGEVNQAFANCIAVLEMSNANGSVPNIAGGLAVSPNEGTWVITSYAVAEAITVPLTGWLAGRFGAAKVFFTCVGPFRP